MTPANDADLLTRTTLQVDESLAGDARAQMIRALQRVPGVLLAEVNAADARAVVVAHDAAVSATSLTAAALSEGVRVRVVGDTRAPKLVGSVATPRQAFGNRQLLVVAAIAFITVAIVDLLVPNAALKHGFLIVATSSLWAFYFAKSFMGRRRS